MKKEGGAWYKGAALVVTEEGNHKALLKVYHNTLTTEHPEAAKTFQVLSRDYWWLDARHFVREYIQGCTKC